MASAYEIHCEMEAAATSVELGAVLHHRLADISAIEDRGFTTDIKTLREAAIRHAERVTGLSFGALILSALEQTP